MRESVENGALVKATMEAFQPFVERHRRKFQKREKDIAKERPRDSLRLPSPVEAREGYNGL